MPFLNGSYDFSIFPNTLEVDHHQKEPQLFIKNAIMACSGITIMENGYTVRKGLDLLFLKNQRFSKSVEK